MSTFEKRVPGRDRRKEGQILDQAVRLLARSTEALVAARDEYALLEEICRIGVEEGGYRLAWIGYARNDAARTVAPVAKAGLSHEYLDQIQISWGEGPSGQGPTGRAIRSGIPIVVNDTETDPSFEPWREGARFCGFRSSVTLPIGENRNRIGALMFYDSQPASFTPQTVSFLQTIASNLAQGIAALRMKAQHDLTVRELAESEERYRSLIDMTPDAIVVHGQGTILFANPASARVFGAESSAILVGRPVLDFIHAESLQVAAVRIADPTDSHTLSQFKLLRINGQPFDAEVLACSITFHGVLARLLVIRDVTERTHVQEQLLQTAKLATLGEMAAGLVHELSQPLNIIRLTAEGALMLIERGKATPDWQTQQFALVAEQCERTAEIIDDIRIFSRRDTSPIQVFDSMMAVRSAIDVLSGQFRPDGIEIWQSIPSAMLPIKGRRVQLEQVVMNLLTNAHHALRDKRETAPKTWRPEINVTASHDGQWVRIEVADNGPGIAAEIKPRLFEPFFTTKAAGRGTGLGLSVSFSLIRAMGGTLEVEDSPEGASFSIALPLEVDCLGTTPPPRPANAAYTPRSGTYGNAHIMVVDDETAAADTLAHYLREMGCRVSTAGTVAQAWATFTTDPADVVITDLRMPAGSGEELVEKLRDFDPLLPIIIVTGHLGATERVAANLEDDRCAILKKPVALGRLGELVTVFLQPPAEFPL
ncbi:Signal transduction histidine kinase [Candidatus Terasakiella magnetica]|nr:Signal transduction histidine kinase [Candidatus Terasakiella magnetica]